MNHDIPEAIAITDKAAKELLEVEALNQCSAAWGSTFAYQQGKIRRLQESNAELLEALQDVCQSYVWLTQGECRGWSDKEPLPIYTALDNAKTAIAKALEEQA